MTPPKLVEAFRSDGCFTVDEAVVKTGQSRTNVLRQVKYLHKEGYLERVRRGLYVLSPKETASDPPDPFVVASKVTDPYLLSYHTALELHGVAESAVFREVYIASAAKFAPFTWNRRRFRRVAIDPGLIEAGQDTVKRRGLKVKVACRELALIQCADRPKYAGGLPEILASVNGFPYLDWGRLLDLLERLDKTVLYRKVGYLLEANEDRWRPPDTVIRALQGRLGEASTYFGVEPDQDGRHEARWHVIVPPDAPEVGQGA